MNKIAASKLDLLTDCIPRKLNNLSISCWLPCAVWHIISLKKTQTTQLLKKVLHQSWKVYKLTFSIVVLGQVIKKRKKKKQKSNIMLWFYAAAKFSGLFLKLICCFFFSLYSSKIFK